MQYGIYLDSGCYDFSLDYWKVNLWNNEFLFNNGCLLDPTLWQEAITNGSAQQLQWLKEKNCPWDAKAAFSQSVNIPALQWLQNNGYDKLKDTHQYAFEDAAKHGALKELKWMRENGWPWSETFCKTAALNHNFEIFKWAVEEGCPVNFTECKEDTSKAILNYIKQRENKQ